MNLEGKTVVVTGGKSGLGAATVRMLEEAGARAVVADLPECDVTDEAAVETLIGGLDELHGAVNCAGIALAAKVTEHDLAVFRKIVEVNLVGTFVVTKHAARRLAENEPLTEDGERGVIVNTASNAAFDGQVGQAAYSASKGGVVGMTLPVARELGRHGIRVVSIAPGPADTPMVAAMRDDVRESLEAQIPFPRRLARPEEYAALVRHIFENGYLNGEVIRLDGSLRMAPR